MNRSRKPLFFAALIPLVLPLASMLLLTGCEKEPEIADPAQSLLYQSMKAMGGSSRITGWSSRIEKGTLEVDWPGWGHLKADFTRWIVKPDKVKIDRDFSAYDHPFYMTYYLNGDTAWAIVNMGVRQSPRTTEQLKDFAKHADWLGYYATKCDTFFIVETVPDDSLLAGGDLDRVGVVDDGDTIMIDMDKQTRFLKRLIDQGGTRHVLYDDYRKAGRVKMPYHVTVYQNGARNEEYHWEEILFDAQVDPAIFEEDKP